MRAAGRIVGRMIVRSPVMRLRQAIVGAGTVIVHWRNFKFMLPGGKKIRIRSRLGIE